MGRVYPILIFGLGNKGVCTRPEEGSMNVGRKNLENGGMCRRMLGVGWFLAMPLGPKKEGLHSPKIY
jgi:hypothetical protein